MVMARGYRGVQKPSLPPRSTVLEGIFEMDPDIPA